MIGNLLEIVRTQAGLSQQAMATLGGTSRPTLSAYEHGRKSPTLDTAERLIAAAGFRLTVEPKVSWSRLIGARGQVHFVPDRLFSVPFSAAFAAFDAPRHLDWSTRDRKVDLADERQRARWYEVVLREGSPADIQRYVDGALLVAAWTNMVVPRVVRNAWQRVIDESVGR